jgi:uncharacterized protein YkwD
VKKRLLTSLLVVGFLLFIGGISASVTHFYPLQPAAATRPDVPGLLADTNNERHKLSLPDLRLDSTLNQTAAAKCSDMVARNYIGHVTPDGQNFDVPIRATHPAAKIGENLGEQYDSSAAIVNAWLASPLHRANLLDPEFHTVGFAICSSPRYNTIVVQHFSSDL